MLVDAWGLPYSEAERYIKLYGDELGHISFEAFFADLEPIWRFGYGVQHFRRAMDGSNVKPRHRPEPQGL
jgi:hypothetical protein